MNLQRKTSNSDQTIELARRIGKNLRGGECIELISDVGAGKTTFVRGLAKGAGSHNHVSSPTFTISKQYDTAKFSIIHFDFYRLQEANLIEHEISDILQGKKNVIIVEWAELVKHTLPNSRLTITINSSECDRRYEFKCPEKLSYLLEGM